VKRFRRPRLVQIVHAPQAGLWRARIDCSAIKTNPGQRLKTLLITLVGADGTKTIGWSCLADAVSYHAVEVPLGTRRLMIRQLCDGLDKLAVKWLPAGFIGRAIVGSISRLNAGFLSPVEREMSVVEAIHASIAPAQLPDIPCTETLSTLSVLVPSRDRPDLLQRLFETCLAQVLHGGGEVIIIDHASEKNSTKEKLSELALAGCRVVRADGVFNYSRLINLAARHATRQRYLILNDDVAPLGQLDLDYLAKLDVAAARVLAAPILVYPAKTADDSQLQHAGMFLGMGGLAGHWLRNQPLWSPIAKAWCAQPRYVDALTGAALLVDATMFHAIGGMDEDYRVECGDLDFCLRAKQQGWSSLICPASAWVHPESASRGAAESSPLNDQIQMDRRRFWIQWAPAIAAVGRLPAGVHPNFETPRPL
jgi:GT2 family glycosyltransferase